MKAELLKHSNFVILTILGEFLVKLCFTVFTFENRGGWFRFINSEYHFRGNDTTSGVADNLARSCPPAECPRLVILERWRYVYFIVLLGLPSWSALFLLPFHEIWFLIHNRSSGDCSRISVSS